MRTLLFLLCFIFVSSSSAMDALQMVNNANLMYNPNSENVSDSIIYSSGIESQVDELIEERYKYPSTSERRTKQYNEKRIKSQYLDRKWDSNWIQLNNRKKLYE